MGQEEYYKLIEKIHTLELTMITIVFMFIAFVGWFLIFSLAILLNNPYILLGWVGLIILPLPFFILFKKSRLNQNKERANGRYV